MALSTYYERHKHHKIDPNKHVKVSKHKKHGIQSSIYVHQQNLTQQPNQMHVHVIMHDLPHCITVPMH